jgi:hypothetical protein
MKTTAQSSHQIFFVVFVFLFSPATLVSAAELKTKNVFLITTDGLRWQEMFTGAEEALLNQTNGGVCRRKRHPEKIWRETPEERRKALLPFIWSESLQGADLRKQNQGQRRANHQWEKIFLPGL